MQDSFSVLPRHSIRPVLLLQLLLFVFALQSRPPQLFTLRLRSLVRTDMTCKFLSNLFGVKIFLDENLLDEKKQITVFSRTSQVPRTGVH